MAIRLTCRRARQRPNPTIDPDNGTYLVAWRDQTRDPGISAARVDSNAHVLDSYFAVASNADAQAPALSNGSGNQWGVTYQQGAVGSTSIEMNRVAPK